MSCCCRIWVRRRSTAASTWARRSSSTSRPSPTAIDLPTGCSKGCFSRPSPETLAEEDTVVAVLRAAPGLLVAEAGIERDVLVHHLMRVEADLGEAAAARLFLDQVDETPAD